MSAGARVGLATAYLAGAALWALGLLWVELDASGLGGLNLLAALAEYVLLPLVAAAGLVGWVAGRRRSPWWPGLLALALALAWVPASRSGALHDGAFRVFYWRRAGSLDDLAAVALAHPPLRSMSAGAHGRWTYLNGHRVSRATGARVPEEARPLADVLAAEGVAPEVYEDVRRRMLALGVDWAEREDGRFCLHVGGLLDSFYGLYHVREGPPPRPGEVDCSGRITGVDRLSERWWYFYAAT